MRNLLRANVPASAVRLITKVVELVPEPLPPPPDRRRKYTDEMVAKAREMRQMGVPAKIVAAKLGAYVNWVTNVTRDVVQGCCPKCGYDALGDDSQ